MPGRTGWGHDLTTRKQTRLSSQVLACLLEQNDQPQNNDHNVDIDHKMFTVQHLTIEDPGSCFWHLFASYFFPGLLRHLQLSRSWRAPFDGAQRSSMIYGSKYYWSPHNQKCCYLYHDSGSYCPSPNLPFLSSHLWTLPLQLASVSTQGL